MRGARYMRLIPWNLRSGSEQDQWVLNLCLKYFVLFLKITFKDRFFLEDFGRWRELMTHNHTHRLNSSFNNCLRL
jgi:hypothetical protein